ncbi:MAG TPA: sugar transferase [Azospirillaceae bacterium]|nr:sugar transferase [Azospirillaceae bacterium]
MPDHPRLYRLWNLALGLVLLVGAMPLLLTLSLVLMATQGRQIFYRGPRLGKDREIFHIYKFRTLRPEATLATRDRVLPRNTRLETPVGRFLRACRLDELPQLFNVIKGDMNLMGPRPVRPEIAALHENSLGGYDLRFGVKPGLVGYTQSLMSHGTSKRIRNRFNARLCHRPARMARETIFLAWVGLGVLLATGRQLHAALVGDPMRRGWVRARNTTVRLSRDGQPVADGTAVWVSDHVIDIAVPTDLPEGPYEVELTHDLSPGGKRRKARCAGTLTAMAAAGGGITARLAIALNTEYGKYVFERYILRDTVV